MYFVQDNNKITGNDLVVPYLPKYKMINCYYE